MNDALKRICKERKEFYSNLKETKSLKAIEKEIYQAPVLRNFTHSLEKFSYNFSLIAEIKRASPSAGIIRPSLDPSEIAKSYEKAGAACLSVLTENKNFQGKNSDLISAKKACSIPVLRKDFILEIYQVIESRVIGADCILLILACLSDNEAKELELLAIDLGMDVIIEVHNKEEFERALKLKSKLIGVNNRNLKTLNTNINTTIKLSENFPDNKILISESGLKTHSDLKMLKSYGANCFLIGEHLLKESNIELATRSILNK
jgi:indole-3-glycerol phosphate synthase